MTLLDRRQITFSADALMAVITASPAAAATFGLPPLKPNNVLINGAAGEIEVVFQTGGGARSVVIGLLPMAALLLAFCFRAKIPLPRGARKAARIEENALVLDFSLPVEISVSVLKPEGAMQTSGGTKSLDWDFRSTRAP